MEIPFMVPFLLDFLYLSTKVYIQKEKKNVVI